MNQRRYANTVIIYEVASNCDSHKHGRELGKGRENKRINGGDGSAHAFPGEQSKPVVARTFLLFVRGFVTKCAKTTDPSREWDVKINFPGKRSFAV